MLERKRTRKTDRLFLFYLVAILVFGLLILVSASAPYAYNKFGDTYYFVKRQILFGLLPGIAMFLLAAKLNYKIWQKLSWPFYIVCLILLILVFIPGIGAAVGTKAHSWIYLSIFHFQPAELAKLGVIVLLAGLLSDPKRDLRDWKNGLLPILAILAPVIGLVLFQPDIGTLSIFAIVIVGILYLAKIPKIYLLILGLFGAGCFVTLVLIAPYRLDRLTVFMHPELDPQGIGYQINQASLAVGSGGLWGLGYGHSRQKYQYLPEVQADSIFAVMAEEMGFIVTSLFIILLLLFTWRCLKIAKQSPDIFSCLLVSGIAVWFFSQSFINIAAMLGLMPLTGVPLPFVSHGGSALFVALIAAGIIAGVSRQS
ncbi:MAG: putative lipid II flippase FtsW [Candidatus Magasanikbacteria bacterium CG10_big_fil_rev_8_21_14_0_10_36_32]|uniref:Probable peptidoglycan glycosyltransferase FtsW n=1 Tax=Candidatus Magasanikbacteria bacterium CG10_big_fil_rev_8_21_14_0_10_36_32 TaxID=1974646 RepID=A0A2M6W6E1_9BACT|nr:MAG: putative lipid II flippase FtsW [Candidatus Magasanikbacteria bacterium CG10_big_fil_rev_8_21_14_0_10_36_32]